MDTTINVDDSKKTIEDDQIEAIRYILEVYADPTNTYDTEKEIIRWFAYYIPHYGIEVMVRSYSSVMTNTLAIYKDPIEINKTNGPKNKYQMLQSGEIYEAELENVKVSKEWIDKCHKIYLHDEQLKILKNQVFFTAPNAKTKIDVAEDFFNSGIKCFEFHNFKLGRENFLKCLELLSGNTFDQHYYLAHYNIACCYARENNTSSALLSLASAVSSGYTNWAHVIIDKDMVQLLEISHFVELVKIMIKSDPVRKLSYPEIPKELNSIDIFLQKNNLEDLEKK